MPVLGEWDTKDIQVIDNEELRNNAFWAAYVADELKAGNLCDIKGFQLLNCKRMQDALKYYINFQKEIDRNLKFDGRPTK